MDSQTAKKNQSLTTAEEMRNQSKLVMQLYDNLEEFLTHAPLSIALGELVFISSYTDFSINKNPPKDGYKYIRYPDSFRACLMQVCNSGWCAFNEAHKNMDQIRLHTMANPDFMKMAENIDGNDEVVHAHLPDQLENIRVIADDCLGLVNSTEKQFTDVINIIQELLEACVNAEGFHGDELDAIKKKLYEAKLRKQSSEEAAKCSEKALRSMERQLQEAPEIYKEAMNSLPSGWEMMGMDLAAGLTESITDLVNEVTAVITKLVAESARNFDSKSKEITKSPALAPKPPMMYKEESKPMNMRASDRASDNFRREQSHTQLDKTREIYEKSIQNMNENQKELTDNLITIRNCEVKEIDFNTTMKMLVKAMDAMERVKEQWEKMVCFFQMQSNIMKTSLARTHKDFLFSDVETGSLCNNEKLFSKDLLYNQAFQATNITSLVHMISATYTEVSTKYQMDRVSTMGKLMAMDKEKPEFFSEHLMLQNSCDEAQKAILRLVLKNKDESFKTGED